MQNALFVQNRNIEELEIIKDCVKQSGIDFSKWEQHYNSSRIKEEVEKDLLLANQYGIRGVPCLVIDGKYQVNGAQPLEQIKLAIQNALETQKQASSTDAFCRLVDGKLKCD